MHCVKRALCDMAQSRHIAQRTEWQLIDFVAIIFGTRLA